ncbi:MAG: hypothetical protein WAU82_06915 [Candidatus Binatus sp.]|uniref:hypothetical protein n=1 Tax=Candidatus Binatus sp. TaxID=2811406 RepID=UPI003BB00CF0
MLVEHLARITQTADMNACLFEILVSARQAPLGLIDSVIIALAGNATGQIKHVKFDPGMAQQMREVP